MKRKIKILLLVLAGISGGFSCTKEITFSGKDNEPRLVLYSLAKSGDPLTAQLSHSAFFLQGSSRYLYRLSSASGTVMLYVNHAETPYVLTPKQPKQTGVDENGDPVYEELPVAPIFYQSDYVVQPGDHLRLVASFKGYDDVEAETDIPICPPLTVGRVEFNHPNASHSDFIVNLSLTKGIDPGYYYRIIPRVEGQYTENDGRTIQIVVQDKIFSNDIIFMPTSYSLEEVTDIVLTDDYKFKQQQVFADSSIPYSPYSFQCSFGTTPPEYVRERGGTARYYLVFTTLSKDLYRYMTSDDALRHSTMLSELTETPVLYSNVKGGLGCFCAYTSVEVELGI